MPKKIDDFDFSRTLVIGCAGGGKTTLSKKLASKFSLPLVHLDKILLKPNWGQYTPTERAEILGGVLNQEKWVIDGMWLTTLEQRLLRATAVVFLDYSRVVCYNGAKERFLQNARTQTEDHAEGCLDDFDKEFRAYIWNFSRLYKKDINKMLDGFGRDKVLTFKTRKETEAFCIENGID